MLAQMQAHDRWLAFRDRSLLPCLARQGLTPPDWLAGLGGQASGVPSTAVHNDGGGEPATAQPAARASGNAAPAQPEAPAQQPASPPPPPPQESEPAAPANAASAADRRAEALASRSRRPAEASWSDHLASAVRGAAPYAKAWSAAAARAAHAGVQAGGALLGVRSAASWGQDDSLLLLVSLALAATLLLRKARRQRAAAQAAQAAQPAGR